MNNKTLVVLLSVMLTACGSGAKQPEGQDVPARPQPAEAATTGTARAITTDAVAFAVGHNRWRREVGVPNIKWSVELAQRAQRRANALQRQGCPLVHDTDDFGENLFEALAYPGPPTVTPEQVVDDWASEIKDYSYETNACRTGAACGHYTQVVWHDSVKLGCGSASCARPDGWKKTIWVCKYSPLGNVVGQQPY